MRGGRAFFVGDNFGLTSVGFCFGSIFSRFINRCVKHSPFLSKWIDLHLICEYSPALQKILGVDILNVNDVVFFMEHIYCSIINFFNS